MVTIEAPTKPPLLDEVVGLNHRDYQTEGTHFLWTHKRGMITDAPGLGKTPQAALAAELPAIIVCPTYLTGQWSDWLSEHFPERTNAVARGNRFARIDVITDLTLDWLIINKEMLRTHRKEMLVVAPHYKTVIFDESHHLRNRTAEHSKGAAELAKIIPRCYELSATPIWKEVDDLYMQLHILFPDLFNSYWDFVDKWCIASADRYSTKVVGVKKSMIKELEELLDIVRIGRTYEQAGRDLPPVIENSIKIDFTRQTRKMYDTLKDGYRLRIQGEPDVLMTSAMEVLHTLRQVTSYEKVDAILETIEDTESYHNGRYVVFTWYKDTAEQIWSEVHERTGAVLITGDKSPVERRELALSGKPIIATLGSLSEGIDLSHCRMVIFAEEHWPPGSNVQSLARVRRERQVESNVEPVLVYYVMVNKTIDEDIHNINRRRSASIKELLSECLDLY